jgi:hypothetical protein
MLFDIAKPSSQTLFNGALIGCRQILLGKVLTNLADEVIK